MKVTDDIISQAFEKAELSKLNAMEIDNYENSLKNYRDLKGVLDTARDEGFLEGKLAVAKELFKNGVSLEIIMLSTGLTKEQLSGL